MHFLWRTGGALTCALLTSLALAAQTTASHPTHSVQRNNTLPAATRKDVVDALFRVFGTTVAPEAESTFVQGDFNGDGSRDLAVVARPNRAANALADLNDPMSNWEVEDPTRIALPDPTKRVQRLPAKPPRAIVDKGDSLLVILHGVGTIGWRDARARQAYVLKNNSSSDLSRLSKSRVAKPAHDRYFPALAGDVIRESLNRQPGFIYWTGAQYVFHADTPPKK